MEDYRDCIFVSYARPDIAVARAIVRFLRNADLEVWFDETDLFGGQDWQLTVNHAISKAGIFLMCLSSNSVNRRGFFQAEMAHALQQAEMLPEHEVYIMPVRLNRCPIPARISRWHVIDLFEEHGLTKLFESIEMGLVCSAPRHDDDFEELRRILNEFNAQEA